MRVPKGWVPVLAKEIVADLLAKEQIELNVEKETVTELLHQLLLDELMVEDKLNDEVREMLRKFDSEIEKGNLDYRKLFDMTKQKLLRERNIII